LFLALAGAGFLDWTRWGRERKLLKIDSGVEFLGPFKRERRGRVVCDAICQEWYPLFEGHFLFGTVLDDFSF